MNKGNNGRFLRYGALITPFVLSACGGNFKQVTSISEAVYNNNSAYNMVDKDQDLYKRSLERNCEDINNDLEKYNTYVERFGESPFKGVHSWELLEVTLDEKGNVSLKPYSLVMSDKDRNLWGFSEEEQRINNAYAFSSLMKLAKEEGIIQYNKGDLLASIPLGVSVFDLDNHEGVPNISVIYKKGLNGFNAQKAEYVIIDPRDDLSNVGVEKTRDYLTHLQNFFRGLNVGLFTGASVDATMGAYSGGLLFLGSSVYKIVSDSLNLDNKAKTPFILASGVKIPDGDVINKGSSILMTQKYLDILRHKYNRDLNELDLIIMSYLEDDNTTGMVAVGIDKKRYPYIDILPDGKILASRTLVGANVVAQELLKAGLSYASGRAIDDVWDHYRAKKLKGDKGERGPQGERGKEGKSDRVELYPIKDKDGRTGHVVRVVNSKGETTYKAIVWDGKNGINGDKIKVRDIYDEGRHGLELERINGEDGSVETYKIRDGKTYDIEIKNINEGGRQGVDIRVKDPETGEVVSEGKVFNGEDGRTTIIHKYEYINQPSGGSETGSGNGGSNQPSRPPTGGNQGVEGNMNTTGINLENYIIKHNGVDIPLKYIEAYFEMLRTRKV